MNVDVLLTSMRLEMRGKFAAAARLGEAAKLSIRRGG